FFFSSRRRHTRCYRDWSSDVCSSDLDEVVRDDLVDGPHRRQQRVLVVRPPATHEEPDDLERGDRQEEQDADVQVRHAELRGERRSEERRVGKEGGSRWMTVSAKSERR